MQITFVVEDDASQLERLAAGLPKSSFTLAQNQLGAVDLMDATLIATAALESPVLVEIIRSISRYLNDAKTDREQSQKQSININIRINSHDMTHADSRAIEHVLRSLSDHDA